jgi:hypothetical protein
VELFTAVSRVRKFLEPDIVGEPAECRHEVREAVPVPGRIRITRTEIGLRSQEREGSFAAERRKRSSCHDSFLFFVRWLLAGRAASYRSLAAVFGTACNQDQQEEGGERIFRHSARIDFIGLTKK